MRPTRGTGNLEAVLARWRMHRALTQINPRHFNGSVLDIGCGSYPLFLIQSPFKNKFGIEQIPAANLPEGIKIQSMVLDQNLKLPFPNQSFECVSSLALLEHLEPEILPTLMQEIFRVLKPSGQFIATTPHAVADGLLRLLAKLGMVSKEEIDEHKSRFRRSSLLSLLLQAGFTKDSVDIRGFQLGMNMLISAEKSSR